MLNMQLFVMLIEEGAISCRLKVGHGTFVCFLSGYCKNWRVYGRVAHRKKKNKQIKTHDKKKITINNNKS